MAATMPRKNKATATGRSLSCQVRGWKCGQRPSGLFNRKWAKDSKSYICAKSGDPDSLAVAVANAEAAKKITEFEFPWCKDYYEQCIQEASEGVL